MLQAELVRINLSTRLPQRLREVYAALGNDAFLIQETLARATLAGRLARSFFASDRRFHPENGSQERWDEWWLSVQGSLDDRAVEPVASSQAALAPSSSSVTCGASDFWENGSLDDLPDPRPNASAVWTGAVAIF